MNCVTSRRAILWLGWGALAVGLGAAAASADGQPSEGVVVPLRPAAAFAYTPGTRRYRLTTVVARTQNQAGGRAPFEFTNTTTMDVTLSLAPRARDTLVLTLTVDTVAVTSDLDAPPADVSGYRHTKLSGLISPQGRIYAFEPPANATAPTSSLYRAFRRFLVPFPRADVAPGTTWSDTTTTAVKVGGYNTHTVAITISTLTGDTTYAGLQAWRVEQSGTIVISGSAGSGQDSTQLAGDGIIRAVDFVAISGVFLGNTSTQTTQLQQFKPLQPGVESTPIQQSIKSKVEEIQ